MRFWTWKFILSLGVVVTLSADAWWRGIDPYTAKPRHLLPYTDRGIVPFIFLLSLLYVVSHAGGWALAKFRGSGLASFAGRLRRAASWAWPFGRPRDPAQENHDSSAPR